MSNTFKFDEDTTRRMERMYPSPEVVAQRQLTLDMLHLQPGETVLDIGCGPGFLVHEMAQAVTGSGAILGMDLSEAALAHAQRRCAEQAHVEFHLGEATALPFGDAAFDAVAVTQVYEFVSDVDLALSELHRVLRPGGRALVMDTDWWSVLWHSSDASRMRRILDAWDAHLVHPVLPRTLGQRLVRAGLAVSDRKVFPYLAWDLRLGSYASGIAEMIRSFVPGRSGVTRAETDAWYADLQSLADANSYFFCLSRYLFLAQKQA